MNAAVPISSGHYVLYWMTAARRASWNFTLDRAVAWCQELQLPLLVLEPLRAGYPWATERVHSFVLDGMQSNARAFGGAGVTYYPYVEPEPGHGAGLLEALAADAAVIVTDDTPMFFLPRMLDAAARRVPVLLEAVDSVGLLPLQAAAPAYQTAHSFRRLLHRELPAALQHFPARNPLDSGSLRGAQIPQGVQERWPASCARRLLDQRSALVTLPIDHTVAPVGLRGGPEVARQRLRRFLAQGLSDYAECSNELRDSARSGLSPYLHFGHISAHEIFAAVALEQNWSGIPWEFANGGQRLGWWGMSPAAESFLDELITWRELSYNTALRLPGYDAFESLPDWALRTLSEHRADARPQIYDRAALRAAETGDTLWNAAQRQLMQEGTIYSYLRMLWGKKVLEWSRTPEEAWHSLVELNNRYALDGRDPNSYSGIAWTFGRYDHPWPERPVFGKVRYMSSTNTARKLRVREYLERFARQGQVQLSLGEAVQTRF